jgi:hypothetical protein
LKDRLHVVREVARHSSAGLDSWMMEGLSFLDDHYGHSLVLVSRRDQPSSGGRKTTG